MRNKILIVITIFMFVLVGGLVSAANLIVYNNSAPTQLPYSQRYINGGLM